MRLIRVVLLVAFFLCRLSLWAQYFSTGTDPGNIKWREIRTENFQLIFPDKYEQNALRLANVFEQVYTLGYKTLDHPPRKISVIIHTHTTNSNGLVAWSPKRMELFTTPNQTIYAQDWLEQLAIHEFRHVVQMNKIEEELPALLTVLYGEQAAAATVGAYLPFWFLEGDAVVTETALSHSGRGRLPSFLMENKAQATEKGLFSYDKAVLGSYRDFVPDRYKFGYWMTGGIRAKYGPAIWSDVLGEIGSRPLSVNPLNRVLKNQTGQTKEKLYQSLFQHHLSTWKEEQDTIDLTAHSGVSSATKSYVNYKYLSAINDSSFVAYKESRSDIGRIVLVTNGQEEVVHTPGTIFKESLSRTGNMLIWSEKRLDLRWTHADPSVIVLLNLETKVLTEFDVNEKVFSPVISPDLSCFAAVTVSNTDEYAISAYDLGTGQKLKSFPSASNNYLFTPTWDDRGEMLYFVALSGSGKYMASLDTKTGRFLPLTPANFYDIRNPEYHAGKIFFTSAKNGVDNIFCMELGTKQINQLSSVAFGADYPSVSDHFLFFSDYHSTGYRVARLSLDQTLQIPDSQVISYSYPLAEELASHEDTVFEFSESRSIAYVSRPYRKLAHLFNFHSWAPAYVNVNAQELKPGISFLSQNKLGTASTIVGYEYDETEDAGKYKLEFEYTGLFTVINAEMSYGKRKSSYYDIKNTVDPLGNILNSDTTLRKFSWNELNLELGSRIPLYFSRGKYTRIFQPEAEYSYHRVIHNQTTPEQLYQGYYHSLTYRLYFQNMMRRAELDLQPDWGQIFEFTYRHSPAGGTKIGDLRALQSYLYFPGFYKNQGLRIYNGYQKKNNQEDVAFSDVVRYPRGFNRYRHDQLYSFGIDYVAPLLYPDLSLGKFFFMKRLRSSLFYDFAHLTGSIYGDDGAVQGDYSINLKSFGLELTADGHFLRLTVPVSIGVRSIYMPDFSEFRTEFLLSVSFGSL